MEILITASIGLWYVTPQKQYYLQVITAEEYNHYFAPITQQQAYLIKGRDNLEIEDSTELPEGSTILGRK